MIQGPNTKLALQWLGALSTSIKTFGKTLLFSRSLCYELKRPRRFDPNDIEDPSLKADILDLLSFWQTAEFYTQRFGDADDIEVLERKVVALVKRYFDSFEPRYRSIIQNFHWTESPWDSEKAILWLQDVNTEAVARGKEWFFCEWAFELYNQPANFELDKIDREDLQEDIRAFLDFCREANFYEILAEYREYPIDWKFSEDVYTAVTMLNNLVAKYL